MYKFLCAMYFDVTLTHAVSREELRAVKFHGYSLIDKRGVERKFQFLDTRAYRDPLRFDTIHVEAAELDPDSQVLPTLDTLKEQSFGEFDIGIPSRAPFDVDCVGNLVFEFMGEEMTYIASMEQLFDINKHFH